MSDSNAIQAQGTLLKMGDGGGPETFTTIGEVRDITHGKLSRKANDVTPIDATREQILAGGVLRTGQYNFAIGYVPGSATHGAATGLVKKIKDNVKTNFKLVFTNSTEVDFEAWVIGFEPNTKVDTDVQANVEVKVTGDPTLV